MSLLIITNMTITKIDIFIFSKINKRYLNFMMLRPLPDHQHLHTNPMPTLPVIDAITGNNQVNTKGLVKERPCIDPENLIYVIRRELTLDSYYRKQKSWPLFSWSDFIDLKCDFPIVSHNNGIMVVDNRFQNEETLIPDISEMKTEIGKHFPLAEKLLEKHSGHLAICGGLFSSIINGQFPNDADFFFYNCTEEKANEILADCVATIISEFDFLKIQYFYDKPRIERQEHITTVVVHYDGYTPTKYQFIHRIYPTLDSIIGGFDIGPCMIAFDGNDIYGTRMGAFSIQNQCMIVDTTRRSTSYNHRLVKYFKRHYSIVFPGLKSDVFQVKGELNDIVQQVKDLMSKLNLSFGGSGFDYDRYPCPCLVEVNTSKYIDGIKIKSLRFRHREYTYVSEQKPKDPTPRNLKSHSDYSAHKNIHLSMLPTINGGALRCDNTKGVLIYYIFNNVTDEDVIRNYSYDEVMDVFLNLRDSPKVISDIHYYKKKLMEKEIYTREYVSRYFNLLAEFASEYKDLYTWTGIPEEYQRWNNRMKCYQSKTTTRWKYKCSTDDAKLRISQIYSILHARMEKNIVKVQEELTGINWMIKNPQRQWTSSFNPIMEDPREFYREYYTPFSIGIPEDVESTIRLIYNLKDPIPSLGWLPKDVLNIIFEMLYLTWYN